jgi:hypothetical protein
MECRDLFTMMLNVVMLSIILLNVVAPFYLQNLVIYLTCNQKYLLSYYYLLSIVGSIGCQKCAHLHLHYFIKAK